MMLDECGSECGSEYAAYVERAGVSWQIVPAALGERLRDPDAEKARWVTQAMLQ